MTGVIPVHKFQISSIVVYAESWADKVTQAPISEIFFFLSSFIFNSKFIELHRMF